MDGRRRALNNVFIERLWHSLKYELIYPDDFANERELMLFPRRAIRKSPSMQGGLLPPNPPGFIAAFFQSGWFYLRAYPQLPYNGGA
jgi:hypothetical protein